jgi:hypothetical protein
VTVLVTHVLLIGLAIAAIVVGFQHSRHARHVRECQVSGHDWVDLGQYSECRRCGRDCQGGF